MDTNDGNDESIIMTPSSDKNGCSLICIEKTQSNIDQNHVHYVAGGPYKGVFINKAHDKINTILTENALSIDFKCYLLNSQSGQHIPERRTLLFWFKPNTDYHTQVKEAYDFFRELVSLENLPKIYTDFIKKAIVLMKTCTKFYSINRILIKFKQMHPDEANVVQNADNRTDQVKRYDEVLSLFEMAYPNNLSLNVLKQRTNMSEDMLRTIIAKLIKEKLIKEISEGYYIRYTEEDEKSQDYQTINDNLGGKKPVVAIITSKYCEKLAIEAIMEDKLSFAQFKKEGESNAYTVGRIGSICVVTTKLPMVGKIRKAQIASANTTTRLLGTFDSVTYVILVGVCGGVPHYADYYNHIRRSDVVVSCSNVYIKENGIYDSKCNSSSSQTDIYILCEQYRVNEDEDKEEFNLDKNCTVKSWKLPSNDLVDLANNLITSDAFSTNWKSEIMVVLKNLASTQTNQNFAPPIGSDLLQIEMDGSFVEVEHPQKPSKKDLSVHDPRVHLGVIGSARQLMNDKSNLDKFIEKYNCRALDYEFDQVIESIFGNRKEHFIIIRGISDYEYKIGISGKWEPNASVNAAAFTKMLIEKLSVKNIL